MLPLDLVRRAQWRMPDHQIDLLSDLEMESVPPTIEH